MRLYHKGTLIAEAGALFWLSAFVLAGVRSGGGHHIPGWWIINSLAIGSVLVLWGIAWEIRIDLTPVSDRALTTLHRFARYCPHAAELLQSRPHPTWAEAFHVEAECRKHVALQTKGDPYHDEYHDEH